MNLAWRYSVVVQVVERNSHEAFYGSCPDFGIERFEVVDPGNLSQEYMFHAKLRQMIAERLTVLKTEAKEPPPIRAAETLSYNSPTSANSDHDLKMVSTTVGAQMLGAHPNTVRALFDSGTIKGNLTAGGHRMISVASLEEERVRQQDRAEMRKLDRRAKKKNIRRKQRRAENTKEDRIKQLASLHKF